MDKNKKILLVVAAVLFVLAVAIVSVIVINSASNKSATQIKATAASAKSLKEQAIEALKAGNKPKAKSLFTQSRDQYKYLGDRNGTVDTEAQIYLIDHPVLKAK